MVNNKSLLLHLVGLILTYFSKMHGHSNIKFKNLYCNIREKDVIHLLLVCLFNDLF